MRKLAEHLHVQAASLYWHFDSEQRIFQVLANEVARAILASTSTEGDWKKQLHDFAVNVRCHLQKFPCSAQLLLQTIPTETEYLRLINALLKIIDPLHINDHEKFDAAMCLSNYVISCELDQYEQGRLNTVMKHDRTFDNRGEVFQRAIEDVASDDSNILRRMYHKNIFHELGSDSMFQIGLTIVISGIEQLAQEDHVKPA